MNGFNIFFTKCQKNIKPPSKLRPQMSVIVAFMPKRITSAHGHIYFIQNQSNHLIKIGYSKDVERRFRQHQLNVPDTLELIAKFYCRGPARYERLVHTLFKDLRVKGEWFRPNGRIFDFVQYQQAGPQKLHERHPVNRRSNFAADVSEAIKQRNCALLQD